MRRTGDHGWSPRACAQHGLRSAMTHGEQILAIVSRAVQGYCAAIPGRIPRRTYFWIFPVAVFGNSATN
jgi:hypothetical protein